MELRLIRGWEARRPCFACHEAHVKNQDFVFTRLRFHISSRACFSPLLTPAECSYNSSSGVMGIGERASQEVLRAR